MKQSSPDRHEFADKRVRLDPASLSDNHAALDLDKRPNKAIVSDRAAVEVYGFNDCDPVAENHVDDACLPNRGFCHVFSMND